MPTSLVHIGDFHAAPGPRNADRYRALGQILDESLESNRLGGWLWPGDLNHARMSIDDRNALAANLVVMGNRAPVIICYGNHDLPGDLDVFARLKTRFPIHVVDRPQCLRLKLATQEWATVFVLPYPTKAGLVAAGVEHQGLIPEASYALEAIFMDAAHDLQQARTNGDLTLMIGHVNVAGSAMSAGQPNIGHEIELSAAHLERLGPIYKGLNHIHKAQSIAGAYYPGSVCRLSWGEIEPKEYLRIDFKDDGVACVVHQPLAVAPMYHVEGELTRDGFTWHVQNGPGAEGRAPASWKGCEVRVRYRFKHSTKSVLAEARVLAEFAEAVRLEVEPIAVPDRELRSPKVAAACTLADKVAAYLQIDDLEPSMAEKLAWLEHGDAVSVGHMAVANIRALEADVDAAVLV